MYGELKDEPGDSTEEGLRERSGGEDVIVKPPALGTPGQ